MSGGQTRKLVFKKGEGLIESGLDLTMVSMCCIAPPSRDSSMCCGGVCACDPEKDYECEKCEREK